MESPESQEPSYTTATQIVRMLRSLQKSRDGRMTIRDLASELEVHPRTVKRYISAVGEAIRIDTPEGDDVPLIWRERDGRSPVAVLYREEEEVDDAELAAKAFSASLFGVVDPKGLGSYSDKTTEEVEREQRGHPVSFEEAFVYIPFGPRLKMTSARVFQPLLNSLLGQYKAEVLYLKAGADEPKRYVIEPLCFVLYRDALYLHLQYEDGSGKPLRRFFMFDRIQSVKELPKQRFVRPRSFRAEDLQKRALGIWFGENSTSVLAEIEFHKNIAHLIRERKWPGEGVLREGSEQFGDESVTLELSVPITPELIAWIASYGRFARVVGPEDLSDAIRDHLADALAYYV